MLTTDSSLKGVILVLGLFSVALLQMYRLLNITVQSCHQRNDGFYWPHLPNIVSCYRSQPYRTLHSEMLSTPSTVTRCFYHQMWYTTPPSFVLITNYRQHFQRQEGQSAVRTAWQLLRPCMSALTCRGSRLLMYVCVCAVPPLAPPRPAWVWCLRPADETGIHPVWPGEISSTLPINTEGRSFEHERMKGLWLSDN